ncbi:MAG TPA: hydrolase [Bacteroidetes bacterium]|nr:hydrolase [Bacteroidota bacterium]
MKKLDCLLTALLCVSFLYANPSGLPVSGLPISGPPVSGRPVEKRQFFAQNLNGKEIQLDGRLDDATWGTGTWEGDFTQSRPTDGGAPSQQTQFKVRYDEKYLYFGVRCFDTEPGKIEKRMSRRDDFPGDWIEFQIDSYHDLRTAFSFTLSVSGVRSDEFISGNGNNFDESFNPIWYGKTQVDGEGWTAEVKIPFSQLRYDSDNENHVWGLQVMRRLFRKEERSTWQHIPQTGEGWVSRYGEMHGLKNVPPQRQIEIQPYVFAQAETFQKEEGNPFADGNDASISAGLDAKVAVTSDLILDLTINPDFGQVEADPSQVRLDGFQNFFREQRPFFVESRNIFEYEVTGAESDDGGGDLLFYSRRIGGSPHSYPDLSGDEHADVPDNTSILGAAKFSGKTKKGWSIGILESVTQEEKAVIDLEGERREEVVEPLANFFVGRLQKDIKEGETVVGGIFTAVNRGDGLEDILHRRAYSGGVDFQHYWNNRTWNFKAKGIFSRVEGTPEAIENTQSGFAHLFQRSDAGYVEVDPGRSSLTGHGGSVSLAKFGGKQGPKGQLLKFETGATWRSPELELNDIGFMQSADEIKHFTWVGYHYQQPFSIFNSLRFNYNHNARWDFGGRLTNLSWNLNAQANFKNLWSMGTGLNFNPLEISNNALRGVSALRKLPGMSNWMWIGTNRSKKIRLNYFQVIAGAFHKRVRFREHSLRLSVQPLDALSFSLRAAYSTSFRKRDQWVENIDYQGGTRSIVSAIDQKSFRLTARLNYNITPDLTIQYYGQPFIFRPKYKDFGYVADALNKDYNKRFVQFTDGQIRLDEAAGSYLVDENGDGQTDYSFGKPDFNFVQFRSNLVVRWEYVPGSTAFLVWSQSSSPDAFNDLDTPLGQSLFENAFSEQAHNIFLVKFTYRFLL